MTSIRLQPPTPFSFENPDDWPKWRRRFEQFRLASGLSEGENERQVSTLLYCMGEDAEDVLASTSISDEERKSYETVLRKLDDFFKVRKNVIFERAQFNRRCQKEDESVEQFITSLYNLVENCAYGDLKDEMIRDRIVVGICDTSLAERLQMDAELTLDKAKKTVRQREAIRKQHGILQESPIESVNYTGHPFHRRVQKPPGKKPFTSSKAGATNSGSLTSCTRCGRSPSHARQECPAKDATCHRCKKRGHYNQHCFSKAVADVMEEREAEECCDVSYLYTVNLEQGNSWNSTISVEGQQTSFKLDTGAEVTVISEHTLQALNPQQIQKATRKLCGPDRKPLEVLGELPLTLSYKGRSCVQKVYVVKGLQRNLLGLPAITSLNILVPVNLVASSVPDQYLPMFRGLGTFQESYEIKLKSGAKPLALFTPRNVPLPLRQRVQEELARMESLGVISKVDQPTSWCAGMVVVPKKSGAIRICVDYRPLNESVLREVYPLPKVDHTLACLAGATVFSKLDANCGFWQIPLAEESRPLTTFITPFGRFAFNKLPFGISSAPELFQRLMNGILSGQKGVLCHMDDVLVFGRTQEEHDSRLHAVLQKLQKSGLTLNRTKCEFNKERLTFLGHVIGAQGISPDPQKTEAVLKMAQPTTATDLRRFMGMVNQLSKFTPHIAELSKPLRELLSSRRSWVWGPSQYDAFSKVKKELTTPKVLALYDLEKATKICADASAYGLGAVLLQQHQPAVWKPVAYASRSMTETEQRYSQIEKESLALVWACEKFSDYVIGKSIQLETDHKPLVPLLGTMSLDRLPPRILRFRLRLTRFDYKISHVPGKLLYTADTLSRAPVTPAGENDKNEESATESFVEAFISYLPANEDRLDAYRRAQQEDPICSEVMTYVMQGWPTRNKIKGDLARYWTERGELSTHDNLLLYGSRIVVPKKLQRETLQKIHQGHQGIQKCRQRVLSSVWWPGVTKNVEEFVKACPDCQRSTPTATEPLLSTPLPNHPWERVAADLFELKGVSHLLVVDYYSRYVEVQKLTTTTSTNVVTALKAIFSRHGVPITFVSDNGPQFDSKEMKHFAAAYGFNHVTSSPHYPRANGEAERSVKTVKSLLDHSPDPYMALLSYRATPLPWCGLSPAELLMGRRIRTDVPQMRKLLIPDWPHTRDFKTLNEKYKEGQKRHYDQRHRARLLPELPEDTPVWVHTQGKQVAGKIVRQADTPRSYLVNTPGRDLRRNRSHLTIRNDNTVPDDPEKQPDTQHGLVTRSQAGHTIRPPNRLDL